MPTINWTQYQEESAKGGNFKLLPTGTYNMRVDTAEPKVKDSGHYQIQTRLVVIDGEIAGQSTLNFMNLYKNDGDPNPWFMQHMAALGFGWTENPGFWAQVAQYTDEGQSVQYIAQTLVGAQATVDIEQKKVGETMRDNVTKMHPLGSKATTTGALPGAVPTLGPPGTTPMIPTAPQLQPVASPPAVSAAPVVPAAAPAEVPPQPQPVAPTAAPVVAAVPQVPVAAVPAAAAPNKPPEPPF